MKAAVLHAVGEVPRYEDAPEPVVGEGQELVRVTACPVMNYDRAWAAGTHYSSPGKLPTVCGFIGAGELADGARVLFGSRDGVMAERAVTQRKWCTVIPDGIDDAVAAAIQNPAMSAWTALEWRAKLQAQERVLILGATGVTGQLAVQLAKQLGAGHIVAAGRNQRVLDLLPGLGADATIQLDQSEDALREAYRAHGPFDIVLDYLWGRPTEVLLSTFGATDMEIRFARTRLVQVGVMAGQTLNLDAEVLRSHALEILGSGSGNAPPLEVITSYLPKVMDMVASGALRIEITRVPLAEVESAWNLDQGGRRTVLVP